MTGLEAFMAAPLFGTTVGTVLQVASFASTIIGSIQQGEAAKQAGIAQQRAAEHRAKLAEVSALASEQAAGQERATSQRAAIAVRKQQAVLSSKATAIAAASGAGALDPTIVNLLAGIEQEGSARAMGALFTGEERARGLEFDAALSRSGAAGERAAGAESLAAGERAAAAGRRAQTSSYFSAGGTVLEGVNTISSKLKKKKAPTFDDYDSGYY